MSRFSVHEVKFNPCTEIISPENQPVEEMEPSSNTLYYEATGTERFPLFSVYLVMNDELLSVRIFQQEAQANHCIETMFPILSKEPSIAIQEFQEYCPEPDV